MLHLLIVVKSWNKKSCPVVRDSRQLTATEQSYSQTQREALAVDWPVQRLHKYLFRSQSTIISDHEAVRSIYHPAKSLHKAKVARMRPSFTAISAHDCNIQHHSAKKIPYVDYLSRHAQSLNSRDFDCLFVQPPSVSSQDLVRQSHRYFGIMLSAVKRRWNASTKRFSKYDSRGEELAVNPSRVLSIKYHGLIPPPIRRLILFDLHSG